MTNTGQFWLKAESKKDAAQIVAFKEDCTITDSLMKPVGITKIITGSKVGKRYPTPTVLQLEVDPHITHRTIEIGAKSAKQVAGAFKNVKKGDTLTVDAPGGTQILFLIK